LALQDPILKEIGTSGGLNMGWNRTGGSKPSNGNQWKPVANVDVSTLAHTEALRAHILNVVMWVTKPLIAQGHVG